jgi:hypothetical protein
MNRHALPAVFSLVIALAFLTSCQPAAPDTNREAAKPVNANVAKETVDRAAIEVDLLRLEREWIETIKTHNAEVVKRILADDVVMTYPDGTTGTKAEEVSYAEQASFNADSWDLVDPKVNVLDADAAVMTGRSVVKKGKFKTPEGKTIDISGEYRFTDVFARRNGVWQVVASQATKIENPAPAPPTPKTSPATAPVPPAKASPPVATKTP